jgi:hypothetical protein
MDATQRVGVLQVQPLSDVWMTQQIDTSRIDHRLSHEPFDGHGEDEAWCGFVCRGWAIPVGRSACNKRLSVWKRQWH